MKIIKKASGKRSIKLSKREWLNLGKKAGWLEKKAESNNLKYKDFIIKPTDPQPPIPDRSMDWSWVHVDWIDPSDPRSGYGANPKDCKEKIDQYLEDYDYDNSLEI